VHTSKVSTQHDRRNITKCRSTKTDNIFVTANQGAIPSGATIKTQVKSY